MGGPAECRGTGMVKTSRSTNRVSAQPLADGHPFHCGFASVSGVLLREALEHI